MSLTRPPTARPQPTPLHDRDRAPAAVLTVTEALALHSVKQPDETAYVYLRDGETPDSEITYRELESDARARAAALSASGLGAGDSVVLLYPSGLEFVRTLLGCMYGRIAPAPVQVPTRRRGLERLRRIADDAGTTTILTTGAIKQDLEERFAGVPELAGLRLVDTETLPYGPDGWDGPAPGPEDIALLQYTSGSTGHPKAVTVTHANFLHNVAETEDIWPTGPDGVVVSWLPLFHDMGMLFGVLLPLCSGVPVYLMEPAAFIRRPLRWLEALTRYRGTHAAAPSFAYELCVSDLAENGPRAPLDLSAWRVAANGAEPVRHRAVRAFTEAFASAGFAPEAMCPGYGLAENTLKATASPSDRVPSVLWVGSDALLDGRFEPRGEAEEGAQPLVGAGAAAATTRVTIVDPVTREARPDGRIGEIWISGPCVAQGYRDRAEETRETFGAAVVGEPGVPHLRTGDLGFMHDGELFVAGRLKDVIIRNGRNFYPQDIELSAENAVEGLRPNCAAAFSVDDGDTERLVVVVETDGRVLRGPGAEQVREKVRSAVHDGQRLHTDEVLLIRRGALPRTTSGKVQRRACRALYLAGELALATAR
ncbi:fatty acyl-AMP ligase [Streptomyces sp. NPDC059175]|uniref:fatty acyl-AMP ligase n=1 Tax=Streptomyces sp. NPDC059175 TaxID=3346757 RepID=UPI0036A0B5E4